uniref:Uncharacterized protein n=1 Tax=Magnetospirillum gryphiswaldense TaxID=55518 RepID=A4U3U8_9PROT|nr:hypothetical protein MGR_0634 [Magnetospirillum gryphiswaldense MSR-1]
MLLRPRQRLFVERSVRALGEHHNTLGVAPTVADKTSMLWALIRRNDRRQPVPSLNAGTPQIN